MVSENRIVVKVGSSLLVNEELLTPSYAFMHGLLGDIAALRAEGKEVVLTSSGSVALGLGLLGADPATAGVQEKQAAAACGQPILLNAYKQIALEYGFDIAQVLITAEDLENRRRFLNTRNTINRLLERGILPIVNENDTVTTEEIRVGDNDRLAAKVSQMLQASRLLILTSIDGLYDRNPEEEGAQFVEKVNDVAEYLEVTKSTSSLGSGGMMTKMQAANMAQNAGITTLIAKGEVESPITAVLSGERICTECVAEAKPASAWAIWLTDRLQMAGSIVVKNNPARDIRSGQIGVRAGDVASMQGDFSKGDVLHIFDEDGNEVARGLTNYGAQEALILARHPDLPSQDTLGYTASDVIINQKNLIILEEHHLNWDQPEDDVLQIEDAD
ncbi:glutamate 5-kinase [Ponticaulis sp.]|uniref:glutamate 5-kinase n=1 Tax=Ponticaulis sp. TaxID=2020902 RepID=UPI000B6C2C1B|nr:glutamate 5-kinase [Ponticaulis sp.]MAI90061.1 glutamate 5-kinase [Ponticaulis sp.]OUX99717.1 MAG: glutamate 5-kinase [Hyphomonadaceae bacterium TMED5]